MIAFEHAIGQHEAKIGDTLLFSDLEARRSVIPCPLCAGEMVEYRGTVARVVVDLVRNTADGVCHGGAVRVPPDLTAVGCPECEIMFYTPKVQP